MKRNQILPYRGLSNLKITTPNPLPGGQQGTAYSLTFAASGGQGNYQWFILHDYSGTGLTMSTSGVWSGTVASAGLAYIVVAVTDGVESIQQQFQVVFANASALSIFTTSPLPNGAVGGSYNLTLAAIGGAPAYTWSLLSQTGTNSWFVSPLGVITGTPLNQETDTLNIQVQDTLGATASKSFSLSVGPQLAITTSSPLPNGSVGSLYTQTISASGGVSPYSWSFYAAPGSPNTYSIGSTTGIVTGLPTTAETDTLYVQVSDSEGSFVRKSFTVLVNASASNFVGLNIVAGNTSYPAYYDNQFIWLNACKGAGGNTLTPHTGDSIFAAARNSTWATANSLNNGTNEEAYLQTDSNGYVTSLTASPVPSGGQVFTRITSGFYNNLSVTAGATATYPGGSYTFYFSGTFSLSFYNSDVTSGSLATSTSGVSVSGLTITSTLSGTQTGSVTFNVTTPSSNGIRYYVSSLGGGSNYLKNMAMVQTAYVSNWLAGQVIHPLFLSWMNLLNIKSLRFMGITNINNDLIGGPFNNFGLTGPITTGQSTGTIGTGLPANSFVNINAGATSCTLVSAWTGTTAYYTAAFADGETRSVLLTNSQTTCTWSGGLTNTVVAVLFVNFLGPNWGLQSGTYYARLTNGQTVRLSLIAGSNTVTFLDAPTSNAAPYMYIQNWSAAGRPTANTYSYASGQGGMSLEYQVAICNAVNNGAGCDLHLNMPVWSLADYWADALTLTFDGGGSTLAGQTGLNAANNLYIEIGNELWNSGFNVNYHFVIDMGNNMWPGVSGSGASWRGMMPCLISDTAASIYPLSAINNTVRPLVASQFGYGGGLDSSGCVQAPAWTASAPPWSRKVNNAGTGPYSIWGVTFAPYAGPGGPAPIVTADFTELQRQSDGGQAMLAASLTQNPVPDPLQVGGTWSFSCVPYLGGSTTLPSGGWTEYTQTQIGKNISALAAVTGSTRTLGIQFYECGNGFGSSGTQETFLQNFSFTSACGNWLQSSVYPMYASYSAVFNVWNWCSGNTGGNNFGLIQSGMQQQTGASAPAMWAGTLAYSES